ncbi:MAG: hypothetical protein A2Z73_01055 [Deltaproteobacteria bacterium RBG_13_60_28]|nr:MAG: hypothetical protein A2Z73_01055 [Deltaproteobacteria bacterium RBG_13_60_28]
MLTQKNLDAIIELSHDLLERIHERVSGEFEIEATIYNIVTFKLFGFSLNTFKSICYLLPHTVYEQATVLYRTLWETSVNLEWISRNPNQNALRFVQFTGVEQRRLVQKRIKAAERSGDQAVVISLAKHLAEFERELETQLAPFRFEDQRGRRRWRDRFSGHSLEAVVREVGGEWLEEYDRDYALACIYTHGAPGAVLFPLFDFPGHKLDKARSIDRSAIVGAMAIEIMARIYRRYLLDILESEDEEYLQNLSSRVREAGTL